LSTFGFASAQFCFFFPQELKRKNGILTLRGVGQFQGVMSGLNIDDVKCIRDALVKVYLPIIMADPELKAQYEMRTVRALQRIDQRINSQNERAAAQAQTLQAIVEMGGAVFRGIIDGVANALSQPPHP
jgi:hypothetical protein